MGDQSAREAMLRAALQRIADGGDCQCDHDTGDCCANTEFHCPECIAAQALATPPPVPAMGTGETAYDLSTQVLVSDAVTKWMRTAEAITAKWPAQDVDHGDVDELVAAGREMCEVFEQCIAQLTAERDTWMASSAGYGSDAVEWKIRAEQAEAERDTLAIEKGRLEAELDEKRRVWERLNRLAEEATQKERQAVEFGFMHGTGEVTQVFRGHSKRERELRTAETAWGAYQQHTHPQPEEQS